MILEIITPEKEAFKGEVISVKFPGTTGEFEVLNNHAPIISTLTSGELFVLASGKFFVLTIGEFFVLRSGGISTLTAANCGIVYFNKWGISVLRVGIIFFYNDINDFF